MTNYYTGIGSRKTPQGILNFMKDFAYLLELKGFVLRSGGATGADQAFESGCTDKQVFLPWNNFEGKTMFYPVPPEAKELASRFHPYWDSLSNGAQALMARNVLQILGPKMNEPSKFVVCWTPDGCISNAERSKITGGTGLAISLAEHYDIPVFNLKREDHMNRLLTMK